MRQVHFADHLEKKIAEAMDEVGIEFIHESENKEQGLDFYLPYFDVYIEVKQFHSDRISRQMESKDNVIAVQGRKSAELLCIMLLRSKIKTSVS
jgi:NMD protein affecting ribosome stability and mRNA decay